jgi:hypothetical protein
MNRLGCLMALCVLALCATASADGGQNAAALTSTAEAAAAAALPQALAQNWIGAAVTGLGMLLMGGISVLMHQAQTKWHNQTMATVVTALGGSIQTAVAALGSSTPVPSTTTTSVKPATGT